MKPQKLFPAEFYELAQLLLKQPHTIQAFAFASRSDAEQARFRWYNFKRVVNAKALSDDDFRPLALALDDFELITAPADGRAEAERGRYSGLRYKNLPQELALAWSTCISHKQLIDAGFPEDTLWGLYFRPRSLSPLARVFATVTKPFADEEMRQLLARFERQKPKESQE